MSAIIDIKHAISMCSFLGNLLALTGDTALTWSSPMLPKLESNDTSVNPLGKPITQAEESWIGSLQYIGAMSGCFGFSYLADRIGRKPTLVLLAIPHIVSYISFAFATTVELIYFGRFLGGISLASVYVILPMYISEIAEDSYRGTLLVSYSTFASFGDLFPYIVGPYVSVMWFNISVAVFPILFLVLFPFVAPESPHYYVQKGQLLQAEDSLKRLRSTDEVDEAELESIRNEIEENRQSNIIDSLRSRHVVKGFVIGLGLSMLQQLSGIGAVLSYTEIIFQATGSHISSDVSSIIVGVVLFLASFGGPLIVDRKGRKFLLICSSTGMIISQFFLGLYFYLQDHDTNMSAFYWLPIVCLVVFTITFNIGFGPLPFTMTSEILPSNCKFMLATVIGFMGWASSFIVTKFFNDLNEALGEGGTFWLFSGVCMFALGFIILYVPETKGKSFQEIQALLSR